MKALKRIAIIIISMLLIYCGRVAEIENHDKPKEESLITDGGKHKREIPVKAINNVYVKDYNTIVFDSEDEKGHLLLHDEDWVFSVLMTTSDNHWIIVERAPAIVGEGRVATENFLLYVPEALIIDIESIDPQLSANFMFFCNIDNDKYLMTSIVGSNMSIPLLLDRLKNDTNIKILLSDEQQHLKISSYKGEVVLDLYLGKEEGRFGQGMESKQLKDLRFIDAIPAFAAYENMLYVIDAINFRIMIYDFSGEFIREVKYPEIKNGNTVIAKNLHVDDKYIYLTASWKSSEEVIYVIDKKADTIAKTGPLTLLPIMAYSTLPYSNDCSKNSDNFIIYRGNDSIFGVYNLDKEKPYLSTDTELNKQNSDLMNAQNNANSDSFRGEQEYYMTVSLYPSIVGVDDKDNIYVYVDEYTDGAQHSQYRFLKVISSDGNELYSVYLDDWWGGSNFERLAITKDGEVFIGYYDGDKATTSTKYSIKRIK